MKKYLRVIKCIKYTPGIDKTFDFGEVAVFKTAKSAPNAAAARAPTVADIVPIQRAHDITEGSCRIRRGTEKLHSCLLKINISKK